MLPKHNTAVVLKKDYLWDGDVAELFFPDPEKLCLADNLLLPSLLHVCNKSLVESRFGEAAGEVNC